MFIFSSLACPYIYLPPTNKQVKIGDQATFRCEGMAVPNYDITWHVKDVEIKNSSRFRVTDNNRELIIRDVRSHDAGDYTCVVRSEYGQRSATASLSVDDQESK